MAPTNAHLPRPGLRFDADGTPVSETFGDVYFSREGGRQETEHVFLRGNGLPERWQQQKNFTIGELGFGSGLNFLVTAQWFLETTPTSHRLHYISFEQSPFTPEMLRQAHGDAAAALIARYPLRLPGIHRLHFDRITLTLAFGDARELLPQMRPAMVDAWFLDGFAPAKNPELWNEEIFSALAHTNASGASFATYTAASAVRRGLEAQGFRVEKRQGFGKKREMLVGHFVSGGTSAPATAPPRFADVRGSASGLRGPYSNAEALIIGGGIAGCTVARSLAERGIHVTLLEKHTIACGASGNEAAALYPQITRTWIPATQWHLAAYGYTLRRLAAWRQAGLDFGFGSPGMGKLAMRDDEEGRLRGMEKNLGLDASIAHWCDDLSETLGIGRGGAWFPEGSYVKPAELCRALVSHPNIALHEHCEVTSLDGETVTLKTGEALTASTIVLANAQEAKRFVPELEIGSTAGQVSLIEADAKLDSILCHTGYAIPLDRKYLIGATYNHDDLSGTVTEANHQQNLAELSAVLPDWNVKVVGGRSALRATTPDRLPYVGKVRGGLYVSTGFGSRGMISAPLAAEVIASHIVGEAVPLTADLQKAIAPLRRQAASSSVRENPSRAKIAS